MFLANSKLGADVGNRHNSQSDDYHYCSLVPGWVTVTIEQCALLVLPILIVFLRHCQSELISDRKSKNDVST